ncbi:WD repeat-containing protein 62 isoform X1 [Entelurus aequoreus]|uniref:WD repeat-containing protein 62 isoform X1 n=1 Tax=Entelurus aequoreus TaxID=161455 RepID=UPI002B1CF817|nr:WD repeat-containing protein 62 isoform X1 [Entelurus aequoreus]
MAECGSSGSLNPAKRKQAARRKSRQSRHKTTGSRVRLEKVLGISTVSSSGLTSDPNSGLVAYPAGCVVVLLHPQTNKQRHIINTSRKPFSALAFSHDGKHLVTGESGHMPCVRVWEVGGGQVAEVQNHKYGVSCVAFSTSSSYIVSVGFQHDMNVCVWDWRKGSIIASNKVSSRVSAISFSQDNSYFVTAGHRHVKFWYLNASKERQVNSTVPLIGRSGLLGDHNKCVFSGAACGRGRLASNTYCITSSALLCLFNARRELESWIELKTTSASCLVLTEDLIFCGCSGGVIRVFSPSNLHYITTLPRPHRLGVELMQPSPSGARPEAQYPNTVALTFDPVAKHLSCVYNDHSVYVWDVADVRNVKKLYSALYHSSCVWDLQVYPQLSDPSQACLPPSSFLTCSSDNTIRLWHADSAPQHSCLYSKDLLRILYVGEDTQHLQGEGDKSEAAGADGKAGIRVLGISPDGRHLATGDRCGNLRVFDLEFLDELVKIEAHDSEVLSLEFSPASTGVKLLATASRDRLIHVFNVEKNYSLVQTLNDHSASIIALKFAGENPEVRMVSCGADKSIYFQTAQRVAEEDVSFCRAHHVVEKVALHDMDLDSSRTHVAVACQDRNVRVYNVQTGKQNKCFKGSTSDEGALLKLHLDPSGSFLATSSSDKNISILDYKSGECVATLFGHSEIVTCMKFSQDCRHLITVARDSCVFVWRLDSHMTSTMRSQRGPMVTKVPSIRRETFVTAPSSLLPLVEEVGAEPQTPAKRSPERPQPLQSNGKLPLWFRKLQGLPDSHLQVQPHPEPRPVRNRWLEGMNAPIICLNFAPSPSKSPEEEEEEEESTVDDESCFISYPNMSSTTDGEFDVQPACLSKSREEGAEPGGNSQLSPDSACFEGSTGSFEPQHDTANFEMCRSPTADVDSVSQASSGLEEDEDRSSTLTEEKFDNDLRALQHAEERHFLNPRLSISTRFLSRFQDRLRLGPSHAAPTVTIPSRISEEVGDPRVNGKSVGATATSELTLKKEHSAVTSERFIIRRRPSFKMTRPLCHQPPRRRHTVVAFQSNVSSTAPAPVQQGAPPLGYLGTTASQDPPTCPAQEVDMEQLLSCFLQTLRHEPHVEHSRSETLPSSQTPQQTASEVPMSPVGPGRDNMDDGHVLGSRSCDITTPKESSDEDTQEDVPGEGAANGVEPLSVLQCRQAADELMEKMKRVVDMLSHLAAATCGGEQMEAILWDAFDVVDLELTAARQARQRRPLWQSGR